MKRLKNAIGVSLTLFTVAGSIILAISPEEIFDEILDIERKERNQ